MFSKKYKEELLKQKISKLSQLDRIEFKSNINIQDNNISCGTMAATVFTSISSVFVFSFMHFYLKTKTLKLLIESRDLYNTSLYLLVSSLILFLIFVFFSIYLINSLEKTRSEYNKENEKFLEERLNKK